MLFLKTTLAILQLLTGAAACVLGILAFTVASISAVTVMFALALWLTFYLVDKLLSKKIARNAYNSAAID